MTSQSIVQHLHSVVKQQSIWIAEEMEKASCVGLGMQEESLTDLILSHIQYENRDNFYTRKFTHKEEGNYTGADWLWCIGEPDSWITFAVQAKIVNMKTGNVNHLHYRNGEQYKNLINFCRNLQLIPKYSIYSKVENDAHLFSKGLPELSNIQTKSWAFTALSPKHIKHLKTKMDRHYKSVLQLSLPWEYIFSPVNNSNLSLAESIARNLENVYWNLENEFRRQKNQAPRNSYNRVMWENPQPTKMVSKHMPIPVIFLLTQNKIPFKVPIANVSVLSTVPVQNLLCDELKRIENTKQWKLFPNVLQRRIAKFRENSDAYYLPERWK